MILPGGLIIQQALKKFIFESETWYTIFDFIERYLAVLSDAVSIKMVKEFNRILEDEVSAYRILDDLAVPITSKAELETIQKAKELSYDSAHIHIANTLSLYADRKAPDYENSIKESISAVEAMCCIITGMTGAQTTLGKAIKKLKECRVHIHPALEGVFLRYTDIHRTKMDQTWWINFKNAPAEDAKYMLVSCSAFVNYLMEKWRKIQN